MTTKLTDDDFKKKLTNEQYDILRKQGTEAPFSGKLLHNKKTGDYKCAACGQVIFSSNTKFDSGTGWPSFYEPMNAKSVILTDDSSLGMKRVEVSCSNCGSHLGHVFNDAPAQPTGMRYCINSASLDFDEKKS